MFICLVKFREDKKANQIRILPTLAKQKHCKLRERTCCVYDIALFLSLLLNCFTSISSNDYQWCMKSNLKNNRALASVTGLVGALSHAPKAVGSIMVKACTQVMCSVLSGGMYRRQLIHVSLSRQCFFSLSFSLFSYDPLSLPRHFLTLKTLKKCPQIRIKKKKNPKKNKV